MNGLSSLKYNSKTYLIADKTLYKLKMWIQFLDNKDVHAKDGSPLLLPVWGSDETQEMVFEKYCAVLPLESLKDSTFITIGKRSATCGSRKQRAFA